MDPVSIAAMASSILAPYIIKGGEAFAAEFGKTIGQKIGDLKNLVKNKFKDDNESENAFGLVEKNPQSKEEIDLLGREISMKMQEDPEFAKKINELMEQIQATESGKIVIKAYNKSVAAQNITGATITISLIF